MGKFAMFLLRLFGWNIDKHTPEGVDKCVVVMGPHTSNWDFIIGRLAFASYGVNGHYLIKKELFGGNYLKLSLGKKRHIKIELS